MTDNDLLPDTWGPREFPVLLAAARLVEQEMPGIGARVRDIATSANLDTDETYRALKALEEEGFIRASWCSPVAASRVVAISGAARQAVGQWPTPETALDRMIAALTAVADDPDTEPETSEQARSFGTWLKSSATTVGLGVATAAITGQLPGH